MIQRHEAVAEEVKGARTGGAGRGPPGTHLRQSGDGDVVYRAGGASGPPPPSEGGVTVTALVREAM